MPTLEKIVVQDFRNIMFQEMVFSPNINCITGGNGEGKTNLLDAIWYLSMTKSAFSATDRYNFRHGCKAFALSGTYGMPSGVRSRFSVMVEDGGDKKFRRDDKAYGKVSEHIGVLPIVMVSPADTSMVSESGEERRKFVNSVLSQMDTEYLSAVVRYNRLLLQRNKLLRSGAADEDLLTAFDAGMADLATPIHGRRLAFTEELVPIVQRYYNDISGGAETVGIEYRSDLGDGSPEDIFRARREKDRALGFTTAGVHRDDFVFTMDGHPIRRCGSQGQQKSFLVALKFAQYEVMKSAYGFPPIMLLDDLFDKLDMTRVGNLLGMVADSSFGQIFLTDSNKVRLSATVDAITSERAYFEAKGGAFKRLDE